MTRTEQLPLKLERDKKMKEPSPPGIGSFFFDAS